MAGSAAPRAMWTPSTPLWRIALDAPDESAADGFVTALGDLSPAVSAFETVPGGLWQISALVETEPELARLQALLAIAAFAHHVAEPVFTVAREATLDWVRINQESFPPLAIGRYYVYGSHVKGKVPAGAIGIRIDAASAFGTGEHATTSGCLQALTALARRRRPARVLDMGTGTGILAIAAAKTWRVPVLAVDLDPNSVRVAAENVTANGVKGLVRCAPSDGYSARAVGRDRPYDLIVANILARPLASMAPDLAHHLAPGGTAILSGLLAAQERWVHAAHRRHGLALAGRIASGGWHTLIYRASSREARA